MEASTGIEPVYTDLQSAASPLRQLAALGGSRRLSDRCALCKSRIAECHTYLRCSPLEDMSKCDTTFPEDESLADDRLFRAAYRYG